MTTPAHQSKPKALILIVGSAGRAHGQLYIERYEYDDTVYQLSDTRYVLPFEGFDSGSE